MFDLAATFQDLAIRIPVFLLALTIHEFAHGWVANRLGDPTAKLQGRLTLNPMAHLDIIGTIAIVLIGFGWAKPVPVDARYLRRPRQDMILISAAGPGSNLILAIAVAFWLPDAALGGFRLRVGLAGHAAACDAPDGRVGQRAPRDLQPASHPPAGRQSGRIGPVAVAPSP